jgi:hypothetical protein
LFQLPIAKWSAIHFNVMVVSRRSREAIATLFFVTFAARFQVLLLPAANPRLVPPGEV